MSNDPDGYYALLEISPGSSLKEIRSAYSRQVKKYNPDSGTIAKQYKQEIKNKDELDKKIKELNDKCAKLNQAKQDLSDEKFKSMYDQGIGRSNQSSNNTDFGDDPFSSFFTNIFGNQSSSGSSSRHNKVRKVEDTISKINLTLEDSFKGKQSKYKVKRNVICKKCDGKGGDAVVECSKCNGQGVVIQRMRGGMAIFTTQSECDKCLGEGKVIMDNKVCKECKGKKTVVENQIVEVNFKKGVKDNECIKFDKLGDEMPGCLAGNLIFIAKVDPVLKMKEEKKKSRENFLNFVEEYRRIGDDLVGTIKIDLFEAIVGTSLKIKTLDGRIIILDLPKITCLKEWITIRDEGFMGEYSRGSLLLKPDYQIDTKKIDTEKIKKLFGLVEDEDKENNIDVCERKECMMGIVDEKIENCFSKNTGNNCNQGNDNNNSDEDDGASIFGRRFRFF